MQLVSVSLIGKRKKINPGPVYGLLINALDLQTQTDGPFCVAIRQNKVTV